MAEMVAPPPGRAEARASTLAKMEQMAAAEPAPAPEAEVEEVAEAAPEAEVEEVAEPAQAEEEAEAAKVEAEAKPAPKEEAAVAKGLAAIARRDKEQKAAAAARHAELRQYETQLAQREQRAIAIEQGAQQALADPVAFFESLGVKPEQHRAIAEQFYYASLGEAAPPDARNNRTAYAAQRKAEQAMAAVQQQRQELEAQARSLQEKQQLATYRDGLTQGAQRLPEAQFPFLRARLANRPQHAADLLLAAANQVFSENPEAGAPSLETLAPYVENYLREDAEPYRSVFVPKTVVPAAEKKKPASPTTLTNNHDGRTPTRTRPMTRDEKREATLRRLEAGDTE